MLYLLYYKSQEDKTMKKETGVLTRRQEALMNFLWEIDTPLTANEMAGKLKDEGWSAVTLFKTVQALDAEGYLMVTGIVCTGKTYARKMAPSVSMFQIFQRDLRNVFRPWM